MSYLIVKLTDFFETISKFMITLTGSDKLWLAYLFAIIIFTVIIKLVLLPLTIKQTHSTMRMTEIQPKVKDLQNKYKNEPQKLQQAQMELYKKEGVSPLAGCLPLLIQFPIFIAMYQVLYKFTGFNDVPFFNTIAFKNLKDPVLWILPLVSGATTYLQGIVMAPKGNDPTANTQKQMNIFMTIFIIYMGFKFKASLVIYWIVQNILQILQQYFIVKFFKHKEEAKLAK